MSGHLKSSVTTGHLLRHPSNKHLLSSIRAYWVEATTGSIWRGNIPPEDVNVPEGTEDVDAWVATKLVDFYTDAIAAMVYYSSGTCEASRGYGHQPGVGWVVSLSATVTSGANVIELGTSSAVFGNVIGDVTITSSGNGFVVFGTSATAPSGNPKDFSGQQYASGTVLYDQPLNKYVWLSSWFSSPTAAGFDILSHSGRISIANLRAV